MRWQRLNLNKDSSLSMGKEGEYVLRFRIPQIKIPRDLTGGHLKEAKNEILLAVRSLIDKAISVEEEKGEE